MSINKVTMNTPAGEQTLIDLTSDSVAPETLAKGATAHNAAGDLIEGKMPTETVLFTPQVLSQEEQAQARENIGAGLPPVLIDLDAYGEIPINLILGNLFQQGGGVMENVDIGNLMDALLTDSPLRVHFTFGVNVLYAYGICVGRINDKAVQLNLNAMVTHRGKVYVVYASIDTPSADEAGKANISMSVEEPGEVQEFPVQSVNGQTGAVQLSATDVGARPDDWMPTAQEVGALPNTYTPPDQTAEQVGADPKGTAASAVSQHNTANDSHNDIRLELKAINDRLTAFFDSDNQTLDELSEIVAYITNNKSLIDSITTSKVSVADIINNLTTNVTNKPLSAAQGVVLKGLIDTLNNNLANYQPKGDYALRAELPAVPVQSVNGKTGDVSLTAADVKARPENWMPTASDVGALPSSELPAAINTALAQAKASGEFDGKDGVNGKDGYTPQKGVDYFDGNDGSNGKDGVSATHSWNGTVLTVTSASGTSSADLKGDKGDTGATGPKGDKGEKGDQGIQGIQGIQGEKGDKGDTGSQGPKGDTGATGAAGKNGADGQRGTGLLPVTSAPSSYTTAVGGITPKYRMALSTIKTQSGATEILLGDTIQYSYYYYPIAYLDASYAYCITRTSLRGAAGAAGTTPVRGTDYWTEADQEEIVQQVIAALGTPVFGRVDAYKNIILTGELADGTYTIKYEDADGVITEIGTLNHTVVPEPTWTNVIPLAVNTDGSPYVGTNGESGYKANTRINSSHAEVAADGIDTTGYIEATLTDTFYFYNIDMFADGKKYRKIVFYDADFAVIANGNTAIDTLFSQKDSEYISPYVVFSDDGKLVSFNLQASGYYLGSTNKNKIAYIRFVTSTITEDSIITKNETID